MAAAKSAYDGSSAAGGRSPSTASAARLESSGSSSVVNETTIGGKNLTA